MILGSSLHLSFPYPILGIEEEKTMILPIVPSKLSMQADTTVATLKFALLLS